MFIQFEETPNPNTLKFLPGQAVLDQGSRDYKSVEDSVSSPLARSIFALGGVDGVFLGTNFVSVTKSSDVDWDMLKTQIMAVVMEHFSSGQPVVLDEASNQADDSLLDEISRQIKELIDTRVKPAVAMDGGNIEFVGFDNGIVSVRMEGACSGCPSATMTLKSGIEGMLKHYVPEVQSVEPVSF